MNTGFKTWSRNILTVMAVLVITGGAMGYKILGVQATAGQILKLVTSDGGSTFYIGRCFRTDIKVQTDSLNANSVDVIIPYNPSYIQPYTSSGCTIAATAINTTGIYGSYPSNTIAGNEINVTGYDATGTNPVNSGAAPADRMLGYVYWKVIAASGSYYLPFQFTLGSTVDTNMAQQNGNGSDVLDSVQNLTIALAADSTGPTFTSLSPANGATSVSVTSGVTYTFSDAGAGVATGTLVHSLNRTSKAMTFSSCTRTNSNRIPSCNVTMSSVGTLLYNTLYRVHGTGSDLASPSANSSNQIWTFTTEDDTAAPYVQNLNPTNGQTGVAVNNNIVMRIKDYKSNAGVTPGLGVDITTVQITVTQAGDSPIVYNYSSPQFSYSGTSADYTITINPTSDFSQNKVISVAVQASDLRVPANVMSTYNYSFTTVDSGAPSFGSFVPAQSATDVSPNTNVSFHIIDGGAGVDISNTSVTVAGITYTSASPQFSYTGSSADYAITINPSSNFGGGDTVSVSISTRDLAPTPNTATNSYTFAIAKGCSTCSVDSEDPARFTRSATLDATISFHVKDSGNGILQGSIRTTLIGTGAAFTSSPLILTGSSLLVAITGSSSDYTFTITLPASIETNIPYAILIEATDTDGLIMAPVAYTFMKLVTTTGTGTTTIVTVTTNVCPSSSSSSERASGGNSRRTTSILGSLTPSQIPVIISRRQLPGTNSIITEQLSENDARRVSVCYIDDAPTHAAASETTYEDVPAGAWYEDALKAFLDKGMLDTTQKRFRGSDTALRAEFAKVLGLLHGGTPEKLTGTMHFDDVPPSEWYATFVEFAGTKGWMRGYNNCIGTHPCTVMPGSTISRAEAAAMIVRFYGLKPVGTAPIFSDVSRDAWYITDLQTAADRCIVQGSGAARLAKPQERLNRAEMIVLLDRARRKLAFGSDCSWSTNGNVSSASSSLRSAAASSSSLSSARSRSASSAVMQSAASSITLQFRSSPSSSASISHATSSLASVHPAAPAVTDNTPHDGMGGLAVATMILMGFVTVTIVSRFLISS